MRLKITHRTEYRFDQPDPYALQRLRVVPLSGAMQKVRSWALTIEGAREEVRFADHFGNDTRLISITGDAHTVSIEAAGEVETVNRAGVSGFQRRFAPLWLFLRETPLTAMGKEVEALVAGVQRGIDIARLHGLMAAVHERLVAANEASPGAGMSQAQDGTSQLQAGMEELAEAGREPCIDHTHGFIAAARHLGFPARFVSGYRMTDAAAEHTAPHAWAEAHVEGLGWVGFDVANCISPDENYVRVATGRDHGDAMPVSGITLGQAAETLAVRITVEQ